MPPFWCLFTMRQSVTMCAFSGLAGSEYLKGDNYRTGKNQFISGFHDNVCACRSVCVCETEIKRKRQRRACLQCSRVCLTLVASMWSCRESMKRSPTGSQASLTPSACSRATASSSIAAWIWSSRSKVLSMCLEGEYNSLQITTWAIKNSELMRAIAKKTYPKSMEHAVRHIIYSNVPAVTSVGTVCKLF